MFGVNSSLGFLIFPFVNFHLCFLTKTLCTIGSNLNQHGANIAMHESCDPADVSLHGCWL